MSESLAEIAESVTEETEAILAFTARWRRDMQTMSDAFNAYANDHSWCDEYDREVEDLNESLYYSLTARRGEWSFSVSGEGVAQISFTLNLDVLATCTPDVDAYKFESFVKDFIHANHWRLNEIVDEVTLDNFTRRTLNIDDYEAI